MEQADREEAVWYYQLGGNALGPVRWAEIEEILETSADAEDLLVARGGDEEWRSADEILKETEEAEGAAEKAAQEEAEEDAEAQAEEEPKEPLVPVHGLREWIGQAWEIVRGDLGRFVTAGIIVIAISLFSALICFPALHAGLYIMALKRFRGEEITAATVFEGFRHFGQALVLYLLMAVIAFPAVGLAQFALIVILEGSDSPLGLCLSLTFLAGGLLLGLALPGAAAFYAMPLIVDRSMSAWEAVKASWAVTGRSYLSHLGMQLSLSLLSTIGLLVCTILVLLSMPMLPAAQVAAYEYHYRDR